MTRRSFAGFAAALLFVGVAGCGGGGGGSDTNRFQPPESPDGIPRVVRIDPETQRINRAPSIINVFIENVEEGQIRGATLRFGGVERDFFFERNGTATQWWLRFSPLPANPAWAGQSIPVEITLSDGTQVVQDDPPAVFVWTSP